MTPEFKFILIKSMDIVFQIFLSKIFKFLS